MKTTYLNRSPLSSTFLLAILLSLSACGGGGGGDPGPGPGPGTGDNHAPVAKAGADFAVGDAEAVALDGSGSSDADGDSLSHVWTQTAGPEVDLSGANTSGAAFSAPTIAGGTSLTFKLTVSDGTASNTDSVTVTVNDTTAPTAVAGPVTAVLGKAEAITLTFDEAMDIDSLALDGALAAEADLAWSNGNKTLTLTPNAGDGEWISGSDKTLVVDATDASGNPVTTVEANWLVKLVFDDFQAAELVLGQGGFVAHAMNQGGAVAADTLNWPEGIAVHDDRWFLADSGNRRILVHNTSPTTNGEAADFVLGQGGDMTSSTTGLSQSTFDYPADIDFTENGMIVADSSNNRVLIYNAVPVDGTAIPDVVLGQAGFDSNGIGCSATSMNYPSGVQFVDGKLIVVDDNNHRVLIWNSLPTTPGEAADIVLGQANMNTCMKNTDGTTTANAVGMNWPVTAWSDGTKLAIVDSDNNRVMIWSTFPTDDGTAANLVLGQPNLETNTLAGTVSAQTLNTPWGGIVSNGEQLFVTDSGNHRILVWDTFPTANQQAASRVFGQSAMDHRRLNDVNGNDLNDDGGLASAQTLYYPDNLTLYQDTLLVMDYFNHRLLMYRSQ